MEIEIFTLCDYAQDFGGKLTIVGTFDLINAVSFPAVHPSCFITGRLRFSESEVGSHKFKVGLSNEVGEALITPFEGQFDVNRPDVGNHSSFNFLINLVQLKFDNPGKYAIELYIDDEWKSGISLNVIKQR